MNVIVRRAIDYLVAIARKSCLRQPYVLCGNYAVAFPSCNRANSNVSPDLTPDRFKNMLIKINVHLKINKDKVNSIFFCILFKESKDHIFIFTICVV